MTEETEVWGEALGSLSRKHANIYTKPLNWENLSNAQGQPLNYRRWFADFLISNCTESTPEQVNLGISVFYNGKLILK